MKELKSVALLLGTMLTKDELDEFMAEADSVSNIEKKINKFISLELQQCYNNNDNGCHLHSNKKT